MFNDHLGTYITVKSSDQIDYKIFVIDNIENIDLSQCLKYTIKKGYTLERAPASLTDRLLFIC